MKAIGNTLGRKSQNDAFAKHLAEALQSASVTLGVFDSSAGFFLETWSGRSADDNPPAPIDRRSLTRIAQARLCADTTGNPAAQTDEVQWIKEDKMLIGIGQPNRHLWPVVAVSMSREVPDGRERSIMVLGLSYVIRLLGDVAEQAKTSRESLQDVALRMLSIHFAVVDGHGEIECSANLSPDWLAEHGGFEIVRNRLVGRTKQVHTAFQAALERATKAKPRSSIVSIRGESHSDRLVWVAALENREQPRALIILGRGGDQAAMCDQLLEQAGLTQAEQRVAQRVMLGKSLPEVASDTGLAVSTVRSYMKQIFQKTNTRRQSEFVSRYQTALLRMRLGKSDSTQPDP